MAKVKNNQLNEETRKSLNDEIVRRLREDGVDPMERAVHVSFADGISWALSLIDGRNDEK